VSGPDRIEPRRRDRAKEDAWIREFLHRAPAGTLAVSDPGGGPPHLNTNLFAYDEGGEAILFHTARTGALRDAVGDAGPEGAAASFSVFEMGRLLPADEALEFSVEYAGVVVRGGARIVASREAQEAALQCILDKYAPHLRPGRDYRPIAAEELKRTAVYRLEIEAWSGKEKKAASDFPGAYRFGEAPQSIPSTPGTSSGAG